MDFDGDGIYYSQQNLQRRSTNGGIGKNDGSSRGRQYEDVDASGDDVDGMAVRRHFREFLRNYHHKDHQYVYRKKLLQMHRRQLRCIELDLSHLREYDAALMDYVLSQPNTVLPFMELACIDALQTLLLDNTSTTTTTATTDDPLLPEDQQQQQQQPVQLLIRGNTSVTPLRSIQSQHMNQLVKVRGIVISAAKVRSRATKVALACTKCAHRTYVKSNQNFFANIPLPTSCTSCTENTTEGSSNGQYSIMPDECDYIDQQTLKLQEAPETVPTGEMPRSVLCCVDRTLVDQAPPGTRCTVICIASLSGRAAYLHIVGMDTNETNKHGTFFTPQEENAFRLLSKRSNLYELLTQSIAPSIQGDYTVNVKKALLCMLMSGCRKKLPDGCVLRGDINVLLLGDPSMAKSQFLKYAVKVAPIGVYTSGKGSSAAGLTASVVRDKRGEFYLEGGAMVLADGGLVAIDEFDKMNVTDRVAIHEAMEQQTISIAKAGITTVLNSRTSVLAAANPVHGRYDELKSSSENIDLLSTILSRFDFIFLLKDAREAKRDKAICQHIMGVHIQHSSTNGNSAHPVISDNLLLDDDAEANSGEVNVVENAMQVATTGVGELSVATMKKYISFCRTHCQPRLSEEAGDLLASAYVKIRSSIEAESAIPITVRQLEALVRVSESLAKLKLQDEVSAPDVAEALRLFRVSTMAAQQQPTAVTVHSEEIRGTEQFLTSRLTVGITVNQQRIVEEAVSKGYNAMSVAKVLSIMVSRGQLQERNQGKLLKRIR